MEVTQPVAWIVTTLLIEAAVIDGIQLRVPNWLTYHFALAGVALAWWLGGSAALLWSLRGLAVGLGLLLPLYAIGGMGAGDVKLLAGVGAWIGAAMTVRAFAVSAIVGGLIALAMMLRSGDLGGYLYRAVAIAREIVEVRNPARLAALAAERKPRMTLLPYGIPLAIGTIGTLAWSGLLTG